MNLTLKKILKFFSIGVFIAIMLIFLLNQVVKWRTEKYIFDNIDDLPKNNVALVLGTSRYRQDGTANQYFHNRIKAAVQLYENDKVNYILVSGDNRTVYYNEPGVMRQELLKNGIPYNVIYMDYAGFRTFDSVVRCSEVFGQDNFTIVSQKFHNQRALYIAHNKNINAVGFNAKTIDSKDGFKVQLRELFARVKVFIDILLKEQPRFLGEPIEIGKSA